MILYHYRTCGEHGIPSACRETSFVTQQVLYSYEIVQRILHHGGVGRVPQYAGRPENGILQMQPAGLLKFHYRRGCQEFGHGCNSHYASRGHLHPFLLVSPAVTPAEEQGIIAHNGKGNAAETPVGHIFFDGCIHPSQAWNIGSIIGNHLIETDRNLRGLFLPDRRGIERHADAGEHKYRNQ